MRSPSSATSLPKRTVTISRSSSRGTRSVDKKLGHHYRSGLERSIGDALKRQGVPFDYEPFKIEYEVPTRVAKYNPDFVLSNGIIIEAKGRFETKDRQKHIRIKKQHPDLDIRFVFNNPKATISKTSKTTYAMWCDRNGFQYAKNLVPEEWINEPRP
jgi:hypothetical protein